eukprot:g35389.t1
MAGFWLCVLLPMLVVGSDLLQPFRDFRDITASNRSCRASAPVLELDADQALSLLREKDGPTTTVIFAYTPYCPFSNLLRPIFLLLPQLFSEDDIVFALVNAETLDARARFSLSSFPTVLLYRRSRLLGAYAGDFTVASLIEFLEATGSLTHVGADPAVLPPPGILFDPSSWQHATPLADASFLPLCRFPLWWHRTFPPKTAAIHASRKQDHLSGYRTRLFGPSANDSLKIDWFLIFSTVYAVFIFAWWLSESSSATSSGNNPASVELEGRQGAVDLHERVGMHADDRKLNYTLRHGATPTSSMATGTELEENSALPSAAETAKATHSTPAPHSSASFSSPSPTLQAQAASSSTSSSFSNLDSASFHRSASPTSRRHATFPSE